MRIIFLLPNPSKLDIFLTFSRIFQKIKKKFSPPEKCKTISKKRPAFGGFGGVKKKHSLILYIFGYYAIFLIFNSKSQIYTLVKMKFLFKSMPVTSSESRDFKSNTINKSLILYTLVRKKKKNVKLFFINKVTY
jgi:hypothetical protein